MTPLIPTELETSRLRLRGFVLDDWKPLHRHYTDPVCTKFTFGRTLTEGESWRDRNHGGWATLLPHFVALAERREDPDPG